MEDNVSWPPQSYKLYRIEPNMGHWGIKKAQKAPTYGVTSFLNHIVSSLYKCKLPVGLSIPFLFLLSTQTKCVTQLNLLILS